MKVFMKSVFAMGVVAFGVTTLAAADNDSFEQRYKAKYGRPSPSEEARQRAEEGSSASRQETSATTSTASHNTWINDHHRGKYGRSTAYEERERGER